MAPPKRLTSAWIQALRAATTVVAVSMEYELVASRERTRGVARLDRERIDEEVKVDGIASSGAAWGVSVKNRKELEDRLTSGSWGRQPRSLSR